MQWTKEPHAGFTKGTPWIGVADNYSEINVENALEDSNSIFYHYQKLIQLRKQYDIITYGDYKLLLDADPQIFAYTRNWENEKLLVISNFYGKDAVVNLQFEEEKEPEILLSNYEDSPRKLDQLQLRPYESIVYYWKG